MEILSEQNQSAVTKSVEVVRNGEVLLYPTDTIYGLGADPFQKEAVQKLFNIKQRDSGKMPLLLAENKEMVGEYAYIPAAAEKIARQWPAPFTLVLPRKAGAIPEFFPEQETIAFRVPDSQYCQKLLHELKQPIISTSANISGKNTEASIENISKQLSNDKIPLAICADSPLSGLASTIISCDDVSCFILREGAFRVPE